MDHGFKLTQPAVNLSSVMLMVSQILLGIICFTNLLVIISYLFHCEISSYLFPVAVFFVFALHFSFSDALGITKKGIIYSVLATLLLLTAALLASWYYFDFSWDGQWYHQAAIYNLAANWNPLTSSMQTPDHVIQTSILHFPKSTWYFGAAILRTFGTIEIGKSYNIIMLFTALGLVYNFSRNFNLSPVRSAIFTGLVLINPVVWSELTTFLNDGNLYLLLVIYLAATLSWLRKPKPAFVIIAVMAICCLSNTKFTGLVFFLLSSLFIFIYIILRKRQSVKSFFLYHLVGIVIAIGIYGFNPYITNMVYRGNPLYPLLGSEKFPSVFANGQDDNEAYETPHNIQGRSLPIRIFYANFGRPGNAPYNGDDIAHLTNPFNVNTETWRAYDYHETRVSGFGPYFSIILVFTLCALTVLLIGVKQIRLPIFLFLAGFCCCVVLSKHFWWPRLVPMFWLIPLLSLLILWTKYAEKLRRTKLSQICGWILMVLIGVNGIIVAVVHMQWETVNSQNLRKDLQHIHNAKQPIDVDYGWFKRSMQEKLKYWDIKYVPMALKSSNPKVKKLPSVVEGYPNQVLYRFEANK